MSTTEPILESVKKALGIPDDYAVYDPDIIMHVNTAFMSLNQMGVGPVEGFTITNNTSTWSDFTAHMPLLAGVKTYVYAKTKILFDPPTSSFGLDSLVKTCEELEWRLRSQMLELEND